MVMCEYCEEAEAQKVTVQGRQACAECAASVDAFYRKELESCQDGETESE